MFVKKYQNKTVYFFNGYPLLLMRAISGLIVMENDSVLLLALAILNDSAPMAE